MAQPTHVFADLIDAIALGVLGVAVGWLVVAVAAALAAERGRVGARLAERLASAVTPRRVRLLVRLVCGAAAAVPVALPLAAEAEEPGRCTPGACSPALAGLPTPDRPDVTTLATRGVSTRHSAVIVVVRPGDTLWSIARRHLSAGADDGAVASAWPRWYAANRSAVGDDPDLIFPGTRLRVPDHYRDPT